MNELFSFLEAFSPAEQALLAAGTVAIVALSGGLFFTRGLGQWSERNLHYLTSFSAGVFLIIASALVIEAFREATAVWIAAGSIAAGFLGTALILRLLPEAHHHHEPDEAPHTSRDARAILWGDAAHNFGDGALLAAAFFAGPEIGIAVTIGVVIHELVQEISEFFVLRQAGYSIGQALTRNFLVACTVFLGVGAGVALGSTHEALAPLLGIAAGIFFYVVSVDLIPHAVHESRTHGHYFRHVALALLGIGVMVAVNIAVPHEEPEGGHEEPEIEVAS